MGFGTTKSHPILVFWLHHLPWLPDEHWRSLSNTPTILYAGRCNGALTSYRPNPIRRYV